MAAEKENEEELAAPAPVAAEEENDQEEEPAPADAFTLRSLWRPTFWVPRSMADAQINEVELEERLTPVPGASFIYL